MFVSYVVTPGLDVLLTSLCLDLHADVVVESEDEEVGYNVENSYSQ